MSDLLTEKAQEKIAKTQATIDHPNQSWEELGLGVQGDYLNYAAQVYLLMKKLGWKPPKEKPPFSAGCGGDS